MFVLDMGEPIKIVDMAKDLIELSGFIPGKDIAVEFTGLRPGEKLFEEILTAEEGTLATKNEKIFVANLRQVDEGKLLSGLAELTKATEKSEYRSSLKSLIPTYDYYDSQQATEEIQELKQLQLSDGRV